VVTAASLASTPFKPFLVTTGNALALEGKFLHRGLQNPGACAASCFFVCASGCSGLYVVFGWASGSVCAL
jgi:hypothetical protein